MIRRAGLAALLVVAACSSGDDDAGGLGGGGDESLADELGSLPLPEEGDDGPRIVAFGDLAEASRLAGVELSDEAESAGQDERLDVLNAILGIRGDGPAVATLAPEAAHVERLVDVEEFVADVGWSVFDVADFVELQLPPDSVTVMEGDFDEDDLTEALGEAEDGVWVAGNPEGLDIQDVTPARPIGEPLWLSLDGDRLVVARSEEAMTAIRREDDGPTVADEPALVALAEVFDDAGAYSGMLTTATGGQGGDPRLSPEQIEAACEDGLRGPFAGVGVGIVEDDGPVFVVAYAHADEAAAEATADAVERLVTEGRSMMTQEPWSDRLTVDDVRTEGDVAVARLRPVGSAPAAAWQQYLLARDNLVTHC